jgi:hypothetical protein
MCLSVLAGLMADQDVASDKYEYVSGTGALYGIGGTGKAGFWGNLPGMHPSARRLAMLSAGNIHAILYHTDAPGMGVGSGMGGPPRAGPGGLLAQLQSTAKVYLIYTYMFGPSPATVPHFTVYDADACTCPAARGRDGGRPAAAASPSPPGRRTAAAPSSAAARGPRGTAATTAAAGG